MNQLLEKLSRLLSSPDHNEDAMDASAHTISTAAVPGPEEPAPLHPGKRRVKENYTSHWDLDYLPVAEAEKAMGYNPAINILTEKTPKNNHLKETQ